MLFRVNSNPQKKQRVLSDTLLFLPTAIFSHPPPKLGVAEKLHSFYIRYTIVDIKFSYRIISLSMAFLLLLSSSGISMDVHFCQGKMKRANIFGKAKTCQEVNDCLIKCGKKVNSCSTEDTCSTDEEHKNCCNNESFEFDLDFDAAELIATKLISVNQQFLTAFTYTYVLGVDIVKIVTPFSNYIPPPLEKNIAVLFQVFRL